MPRRTLLFVCLLGALAGCGSTADQPSGTAADGPPVTASLPSTSTADAAPTDLEIPVVPITGDERDMPIPYFGSQAADGGVAAPVSGFAVAVEDMPFCDALDVINGRPQPRDDYEEMVVAQQYFSAIAPVVPAELDADFAVVLEFVAQVVDSGSFVEGAEPQDGDALLGSIDTITAFVDQRCLGR